MINRKAAALAAVVLAGLLTGCETTEQKSAAIARSIGHVTARTKTEKIKNPNATIHVIASALVHAGGSTVAALELNNTGAAQADVPVLINVTDAQGKSVYSNDTVGIAPSLQQLAFVPASSTVWWVDDQVLASASTATNLSAAVGTAKAPAPTTLPSITTSAVKSTTNFIGPIVTGTVTNHSAVAQTDLALYAVAVRSGQVLAAGSDIIPALAPGASATFEIPLTGKPDGAAVQLTVAPANLG
jgi:hypothetical protein